MQLTSCSELCFVTGGNYRRSMQRKRAANLVTNIYESITRNYSITQLESICTNWFIRLALRPAIMPSCIQLVYTAISNYLCLATWSLYKPAVGLLPTSGPKFSARTIISGKFGPGGPKFSAIILVPDQNYRGPFFQWQVCMCVCVCWHYTEATTKYLCRHTHTHGP